MRSTEPGGAAIGYRPSRTLGVWVELARQLARRRTKGAFAFLAVFPLLMVAAFAIGSEDSGGADARVTLVDVATNSALNFTLFVLFATTGFFLVVIYALFFGDTIASEAGWGSLRYLLAAPVPRARLLRQKFFVALLLGAAALVLLTAVSLLAGTLFYGWGPVQTPVGITLTQGEALFRLSVIVGYLGFTLITVGSLAFLFSVLTDAPLAAVGGAVFVMIVSSILEAINALGPVRDFLPSANQFAWIGTLSDPMQTGDMLSGALLTVVYGSVFSALAWWHFGRKDVLS
ncbi:ABC transporter permease [soil metagenome]